MADNSEIITRVYTPRDVPALSELWIRVFGDSEEFVSGFFRMLPDIGSCVLMEKEGRVIAMASVITGSELKLADGSSSICGYIYAVAVDEAFRSLGLGKGLVKAAAKLGRERGAGIICTLPATEELYGFYSDAAGLVPALRRVSYDLPAKPSSMTMKLTSTEYNFYRESMLRGRTYLRPSSYTMDFQRFLCESSGGGLYAAANGICTAVVDEGGSTCICHEIIAATKADCDETASAVAAELGCERARYYLPSLSGESFIAAEPGKIPPDAVWNLAFE